MLTRIFKRLLRLYCVTIMTSFRKEQTSFKVVVQNIFDTVNFVRKITLFENRLSAPKILCKILRRASISLINPIDQSLIKHSCKNIKEQVVFFADTCLFLDNLKHGDFGLFCFVLVYVSCRFTTVCIG